MQAGSRSNLELVSGREEVCERDRSEEEGKKRQRECRSSKAKPRRNSRKEKCCDEREKEAPAELGSFQPICGSQREEYTYETHRRLSELLCAGSFQLHPLGNTSMQQDRAVVMSPT